MNGKISHPCNESIIANAIGGHRSIAGGEPEAAVVYGLAGDLGPLSAGNDPNRSIRDAGDAFAERGDPGREEMEIFDRAGVSEDGEGSGPSPEDMVVLEDDSFRRNSTHRCEKD